ncbi:GyrI-like domain-containing protein [Brachybacterium sp. J144]|uniref:GyrI-like domain-containing protein n=1 Tax=Brachybacterium sp. J144 TaxID=3116487 RepID=UPI002E775B31|nr:GyrI-like domain-containing protein [Brachybacterium sp. J144]MEE1651439.1 GyrI-like domain-containing protein [Brachybacterium sp. J144]
MSAPEITVRPLPVVRLAALRVAVREQAAVGEVVGPLFARVEHALEVAGLTPQLPIAAYAMDATGLQVTVGFTVDGEVPDGLETVDLPAAEESLCLVHVGTMEGIGASWGALHEAVAARGREPVWPSREVYVRSEGTDQRDWLTELQQPLARSIVD